MRKILVIILIVFVAGVSCKKDLSYDIERSLLVAHHKLTPVDRPTQVIPDLSIDQAYKIQDRILSSLKKLDVPWAGYKISPKSLPDLTYPGGMAPVFGRVINTWLKPNKTEVNSSKYVNLFMENEIAWIIKDNVPVDEIKTKEDLMPYILGVAPAVELPDVRFKGSLDDVNGVDIATDNGAVGGVIIGEVKPLADMDVDKISAVMSRNGEVISEGNATNIADSQWDIMLWLVNELSKRKKPLKAGWFVITGSMGKFM
ncbi:hypothetical protein KKA47_06570, partial [bacterium]|nr:hypothetical protein [bacterium]